MQVFTMILESGDAAARAHKGYGESMPSWHSLLEQITPYNENVNKPATAFKAGAWLSESKIHDILEQGNNIVPESWYLTASIISILPSGNTFTLLSSAFVLHTLLLKHLRLSQRRLPVVTFEDSLEESIKQFLENFSETATAFLSSEEWTATMRANDITSDLVDMVDGRLFRAVIRSILQGTMTSTLPPEIKDEWSSASKLFQDMSRRSLSLDKELGDTHSTETENQPSHTDTTFAVMPFSNPVFDKHLACIHVTADAALPAHLSSMKLYRETTHWHNRKPLVTKQAPVVKLSKWKNPLRMNQFYMAEMTAYAASLTGAKGKVLDPETITVGPKKLIKPAETTNKSSEPGAGVKKGGKDEKLPKNGKVSAKSEESSGNKKGGKKATAGLSKAQQIIAGNKEKKGGAESDKAFSAWAAVMKGFDEIPGDQDRYLRTKTYLDALDSAKSVYVEADIELYLIQSLLSWWAKYCKASKKSEGYHVVALIWNLVRATCSSKSLSKEIAQHVEKICTILSITDAMGIISKDVPDRKLSFVFKYPLNPQPLSIGLSQVEFQLLHVGPYMDRFLDAQPDARVSSFVPDGWQREVLDELDANNSVFVVAPTSAGKTFISFYAMEQILRADNDGVLVYVAPTKALVNQIAAEIQGRFSKKFPQTGKSVWAIHTRDYRVNNSTGCQILVTVPHILQIMLLAPTNAKSWAPRVKRIIFDEIHSIGQAEDGVVWEQLLLLAPCPIIALSATVGNPTEFSDWLTETQKASGTKLTMIKHSTRYSDLRKYQYQPPRTFKFEGFGKSQGVLLGLDGLDGLTYFHPIASLIDKSRGMPDDLALEPRDCLLLWKAMCKFQTDEYPVPKSLDPAKALPACIKKADIFKWEKELKKVILQWMAAGRSSPFDKVVQELSPPAPAPNNDEDDSSDEDISAEADESDRVNSNDLRATTLPLLYQLHKRGALPAILFNYDRSGCEDIASSLLKQLTSAEERWKQGKEWQRKLEDWTKWKKLKEKKGAQKPAKASKKKGNDDDENTSKVCFH